MYRFSRQIYMQIRDAVDPHPDTVSVAEARRRILPRLRGHRRAAGARRALLPEARAEPVPGDPVLLPDHRAGAGLLHHRAHARRSRAEFIREEIERSGEGAVVPCRATTRKGKPCQRTPLPGREYCPSHAHLEEKVPAIR